MNNIIKIDSCKVIFLSIFLFSLRSNAEPDHSGTNKKNSSTLNKNTVSSGMIPIQIKPENVTQKQCSQDYNDIKEIIITWMKKNYLPRNKKEIDIFCKKSVAAKKNPKYKNKIIEPGLSFSYVTHKLEYLYDNNLIILQLNRVKGKLTFDHLVGIMYNNSEKKERFRLIWDSSRFKSLQKLRQDIVKKIEKECDFFKLPPSVLVDSYQDGINSKIYYFATIYFGDSCLKPGVSKEAAKKLLSIKIPAY